MDWQKAIDDGHSPEDVMGELSTRGVKMDWQKALADGHDPLKVVAEMGSRETVSIKTDTTPDWKYWMSENVPAIGEVVGSIAGAVLGTAAGAPAGPWAPAVGVAGAGYGAATGRQTGNVVNQLLDVPVTPEPGSDLLSAAGRGMAMEMGGQAAMNVASKVGAAVLPRYPSAKARAGEIFANASKTGSEVEAGIIGAKESEVAAAQQGLGVPRMPETTVPNVRKRALAQHRANANPEVRAAEDTVEAQVREQAAASLEGIVPSARKPVVDKVRTELSKYNQRAVAQSETDVATQATKEAEAALAAKAEADAKLSAASQGLEGGLAGKADVQAQGEAIRKATAEGKDLVSKVFNEHYAPYDANPSAVSEAVSFNNAVKSLAERSSESGNVLRNYASEGSQIERRLMAVDDAGEAAMPEVMPLAQWRGLKGELHSAAAAEIKSGNHQIGRELSNLANLAKAGELQAVEAIGDRAAVEEYALLSSAYNNMYIGGFRQGFVGPELLKRGSEIGGVKTESAQILPKLKGLDNADSLMLAFGAEKAAASGRVLDNMSHKELMALGKSRAREFVAPHLESEIATKYYLAGGGEKGAKSLRRFMLANEKVYEKYGLSVEGLQKSADRIMATAEELANISGVASATRAKIVAKTLSVSDPYKVADYVLKSGNPKIAFRELLLVSKDVEWRNSITGLVKDKLKAEIDRGADVFANQKTVEAMEAVFSKPQLTALRDYRTLLDTLRTSSARTTADNAAGPTIAGVTELGLSTTPVGMGKYYAAKQILKLQFKGLGNAYTTAVNRYVDDALIDPRKALTLSRALAGRNHDIARLRGELKVSGQILAKYENSMRVLSNLGLQATGARDAEGINP